MRLTLPARPTYAPFLGALAVFTALSLVIPSPWKGMMETDGISLVPVLLTLLFGALLLWPMLFPRSRNLMWLAIQIALLLLIIGYLWEITEQWMNGNGIRWTESSSFLVFLALFPGIWLSEITLHKLRYFRQDDVWFQSLLGMVPFALVNLWAAVFLTILMAGKLFEQPVWSDMSFWTIAGIAGILAIISIVAGIRDLRR